MNQSYSGLRTLLALLLALCFYRVEAAEVIQISSSRKVIAISNDDTRAWRLKDSICVYQIGVEAACGTVVKVIKQGALVRIGVESKTIEKGDTVGLVRASRRVASTGSSTGTASYSSTEKNWDFAAGVGGGTSYFFPILNLQRKLSNNLTLGAVPFFVSSATALSTVTALGGYLTLNYYFDRAFKGFWIQVGAGAVDFSINSSGTDSSSLSISGLGTAGYRLEITPSINVGVAIGVLYVSPIQSDTVIISLSGALPYATADVGFSF